PEKRARPPVERILTGRVHVQTALQSTLRPGVHVDLRRNTRPDADSTGGCAEGDGVSQLFTQPLHGAITPYLIDPARAPRVTLHVAIIEQLGNGAFERVVALAVESVAMGSNRFQQRSGPDHVSQSYPRCDDLRQRPDIDDDSGAVRARHRQYGPPFVV